MFWNCVFWGIRAGVTVLARPLFQTRPTEVVSTILGGVREVDATPSLRHRVPALWAVHCLTHQLSIVVLYHLVLPQIHGYGVIGGGLPFPHFLASGGLVELILAASVTVPPGAQGVRGDDDPFTISREAPERAVETQA